jgi:hypothetical protein
MPVFTRTEQSVQNEQHGTSARLGVVQFGHSLADIGLSGFTQRYFLRGI